MKLFLTSQVKETIEPKDFMAAMEKLEPIGPSYLGYIIPLVVFIFATVLTIWLYRHFSKDNT